MIKRICTFLLIAIALLSLPAAVAESDRPNIVVVVADDMAWGDSATYAIETSSRRESDLLNYGQVFAPQRKHGFTPIELRSSHELSVQIRV